MHKNNLPPFDERLVKDTIYLLWEKKKIPYEYFFQPKKQEYFDNIPYYSDYKKGLIFHLSNSHIVIFEDGSISETLKIENLKSYKLNLIEKIDSIDTEWVKKNQPILENMEGGMAYYKVGIRTYDRSRMYVTYLIKTDDNKKEFTIYPVIWDNQNYIY